jgi:hypothetical protein
MAKRQATERKIKYVGDADVRRIEAGDDFGGRLADPLEEDLEWSWDNNHLLTANIRGDVADLLLEDSENFVDVANVDVIPVAKVAARRRAAKSHEDSATMVDLNSASQGALVRGDAGTPGSVTTPTPSAPGVLGGSSDQT